LVADVVSTDPLQSYGAVSRLQRLLIEHEERCESYTKLVAALLDPRDDTSTVDFGLCNALEVFVNIFKRARREEASEAHLFQGSAGVSPGEAERQRASVVDCAEACAVSLRAIVPVFARLVLTEASTSSVLAVQLCRTLSGLFKNAPLDAIKFDVVAALAEVLVHRQKLGRRLLRPRLFAAPFPVLRLLRLLHTIRKELREIRGDLSGGEETRHSRMDALESELQTVLLPLLHEVLDWTDGALVRPSAQAENAWFAVPDVGCAKAWANRHCLRMALDFAADGSLDSANANGAHVSVAQRFARRFPSGSLAFCSHVADLLKDRDDWLLSALIDLLRVSQQQSHQQEREQGQRRIQDAGVPETEGMIVASASVVVAAFCGIFETIESAAVVFVDYIIAPSTGHMAMTLLLQLCALLEKQETSADMDASGQDAGSLSFSKYFLSTIGERLRDENLANMGIHVSPLLRRIDRLSVRRRKSTSFVSTELESS